MFTHLDDPAPPALDASRRTAIAAGVHRGRRRRRLVWSAVGLVAIVGLSISSGALVGSKRSVPLTTTDRGSRATSSSTTSSSTTSTAPAGPADTVRVSQQAGFEHLLTSGGLVFASGSSVVIVDPPATNGLSFPHPAPIPNCVACQEMTLSPDRTALALVAGSLQLVTADQTTQLPGTANSSHPAWSPDSQRLAFDSPANNPDTISVINRSGTGLHPVALGRDPVWSADGKRIYFDSITEPARIMRMDADGSNIVQITRTSTEQVRPSPSPDGKLLAFYDGGTRGISVSNIDGTNVRHLTDCRSESCRGESVDEPRWSPDSSRIAYVLTLPAGATQIWVVTVANPAAAQLVAAAGDPCCLSWR
jgi:Tol biopolymer transport system component